MKISQVKVGAVINTGQYSDIRPEITVDLTAKDKPEQARDLAMQHISKLYKEYGGEGVKLNNPDIPDASVARETMKCFISGTEAFFDELSHTYVNENNELYTSGSGFAHQYKHEFNKKAFLPKSAAKLEASEEFVEEFWKSKGDCSTTLGTALHKALEHYGKYRHLFEKDTDSKTKLPKFDGVNPLLRKPVQAFFDKYGDEEAFYEKFIADPKLMRCGQVDRLVVVGNKEVIIDDFKTNYDLFKVNTPKYLKAPYQNVENTPFGAYRLQFSFYRAIFLAHGWTVKGMRLHHWNSEEERWDEYEVKAVEIDGAKQERIDISQVV